MTKELESLQLKVALIEEMAAELIRLREELAKPEQEPVTLMSQLALTIGDDAAFYRQLVWNLSEKVMGVAMSAESVKGQANRVQVTTEAMSNLRRFVEKGVTEQLAFKDKVFDTHIAAVWKLNAAPQPAQQQDPVATENELSNGLAMALHDAVLIRIGGKDDATKQACARIDKMVEKYRKGQP